MPKVALSLQAAKDKESDILSKLSKVQQASKTHKQQTKLNQQRHEWIEQLRSQRRDAKRLEEELRNLTESLNFVKEMEQAKAETDELANNTWFQVNGVRQLMTQLRSRNPERLQKAPAQALALQDIFTSVAAALGGQGMALAAQAYEFESELRSERRALRSSGALAAGPSSTAAPTHGGGGGGGGAMIGLWSSVAAESGDLSDEEEGLLERLQNGSSSSSAAPRADGLPDMEEASASDEGITYATELRTLSDEMLTELEGIESELQQLKTRNSGWSEEASFRFGCIKKQFQGKGRDLMMDRLAMEFPHLTREQIQSHEAQVDAFKFATQKRAATFRQWRKDRWALFRKYQGLLVDRERRREEQRQRKVEMEEQRERTKQIRGDLMQKRRSHSLRKQAQQEVEQEQLRQREAALAEREREAQKHVASVKERAKEFAEKKREQQLKKEEEEHQREQAEHEEKAKRMEKNAEIIRLRREMDAVRAKERQQLRESAEEEQRERERRLQKAIEMFKVEAPRDPERLLKLPASAQSEAYADPFVCVTRGPACGFDEKRLMSDARYKLSAALQAAGLFGTKAGQEALSRVAAPRPAQPHIMSQVFAAGYPG